MVQYFKLQRYIKYFKIKYVKKKNNRIQYLKSKIKLKKFCAVKYKTFYGIQIFNYNNMSVYDQ